MPRPKRRSHAAMQQQCDQFNKLVPVGSPVRVWTGYREGEGRVTEVSYPAQILGGHTAGVYTKDFGFVALSHVDGV